MVSGRYQEGRDRGIPPFRKVRGRMGHPRLWFWGNLGSNKWDYGAVWTYGLLLTVLSIRWK